MRITKERFDAQEQKKRDLDRLARAGRLRPLKKGASPEEKRRLEKERTREKHAELIQDETPREKQKNKKLAGLLRRLRGTPKKKHEEEKQPVEYVEVAVNEETGEYVDISENEEDTVAFREYSAYEQEIDDKDDWETADGGFGKEENENRAGEFNLVYKKNASLPNGLLSTALSVAVGIIYYDETGGLVDRLITVRRIFGRNGDVLIDAFCHDIEAPRMILLSKAVRLYDIKTLFAYADPTSFLLHDIGGYAPDETFKDNGFIKALSIVRYDLAALAYLAKADADKSDMENRLIFKYVKRRCASVFFDEQQMMGYISRLFPDEQSFYEAVDVIVKYPQEDLQLFVETFLQLVLSDSVIHDNERELLAELLYVLRRQGVELNILGLK